MTLDLLVKNANLPDGRTGIDIACRNGRIEAVEAGIKADARETIDAAGKLVSPPFIDSHFSHGRDALSRAAAHEPQR